MGSILVLSGKSAVGKDTVANELMKSGRFERLVDYTTRQKRSNETNGVEHYFITDEEADRLIAEFGLIECREYNHKDGRCRYFEVDNLDRSKNYLITTSPQAGISIKDWADANEIKCTCVIIDVDTVERLKRAYRREQNEEVKKYDELIRRFIADEDDYEEVRSKLCFRGFHIVNNNVLERTVKFIEEILDVEDVK